MAQTEDGLALLEELAARFARLGLALPGVEVRWQDLQVEATPPSLAAAVAVAARGAARRRAGRGSSSGHDGSSSTATVTATTVPRCPAAGRVILDAGSGVLAPGSLTLLLGPPGGGRSTLLKALAGRLVAATPAACAACGGGGNSSSSSSGCGGGGGGGVRVAAGWVAYNGRHVLVAGDGGEGGCCGAGSSEGGRRAHSGSGSGGSSADAAAAAVMGSPLRDTTASRGCLVKEMLRHPRSATATAATAAAQAEAGDDAAATRPPPRQPRLLPSGPFPSAAAAGTAAACYCRGLAAYVGQSDDHLPLLTAGEVLAFAAACQAHGLTRVRRLHRWLLEQEKEKQEEEEEEEEGSRRSSSSNSSAAARGGRRSSSMLDEQQQQQGPRVLMESRLVEAVASLLGLGGVLGTRVGDEMTAGLSGGEKRRLTIGEAVVGLAPVLMLDEVTNGLDAAVALALVRTLRRVCDLARVTAVAALLQPSPELVALSDNVLLLAAGRVVFLGPRDRLLPFLARVPRPPGLAPPPPPAEGGSGSGGSAVDTQQQQQQQQQQPLAEFAQEVFASPASQAKYQAWRRRAAAGGRAAAAAAGGGGGATAGGGAAAAASATAAADSPPLPFEAEEGPVAAGPWVSPAQARKAFERSEEGRALAARMAAPPYTHPLEVGVGAGRRDLAFFGAARRRQQPAAGRRARGEHPPPPPPGAAAAAAPAGCRDSCRRGLRLQLLPLQLLPLQLLPLRAAVLELVLVLRRELVLVRRDSAYLGAIVGQFVFQGFVVATAFLRPPHPRSPAGANLVLAALAFSLMGMFMLGFNSAPVYVARLPVFYKQRDAGMVSPAAYAAAALAARLPEVAVCSAAYSALAYFAVGLTPEPGRFFLFLASACLSGLSSVASFQLLGALSRRQVATQGLGAVLLMVNVLCSGFPIARTSIPGWWIWFYWVSPMAWILRSMAVSEMSAARWQLPAPAAAPPTAVQAAVPADGGGGLASPAAAGMNIGLATLAARGYPTAPAWVWAGPVYLAATTLLQLAAQAAALGCIGPLEGARTGGGSSTAGSSMPPEEGEEEEEEGGLLQPVLASGVDLPARPPPPLPVAKAPQPQPPPDTRAGQQQRLLQLLDGVSGAFRPGALTALMGASGAGKTTLLDLLAGRKRATHIRGSPAACATGSGSSSGSSSGGSALKRLLYGLRGGGGGSSSRGGRPVWSGLQLVNGQPVPDRITGGGGGGLGRRVVLGYVEQQDAHNPYSTVEEALLFSARLRVPDSALMGAAPRPAGAPLLAPAHSVRSVAAGRQQQQHPSSGQPYHHEQGQRQPQGLRRRRREVLLLRAHVRAVMALVELDGLEQHRIGGSGVGGGGGGGGGGGSAGGVIGGVGLDTRAAGVVMRAVTATAATGRTVVCTIHQPSRDIMNGFDELLLLKPGGRTAYWGPLGPGQCRLVAYFTGAAPHVPRPAPCANPADWVLGLTAPGAEAALGLDWGRVWAASAERRAAERMLDDLCGGGASGGGGGGGGGGVARDHVDAGLDVDVDLDVDVEAGPHHPPQQHPHHHHQLQQPPPPLQQQQQQQQRQQDHNQHHLPADRPQHQQQHQRGGTAAATTSNSGGGGRRYAQPLHVQLRLVLWRQLVSQARNRAYNGLRLAVSLALAGVLGSLYWRRGLAVDSDVGVLDLLGVIYTSALFLPLTNMLMVMAVVESERVVYYRERAAHMYSGAVFAAAQSAAKLWSPPGGRSNQPGPRQQPQKGYCWYNNAGPSGLTNH
ncbi:hypothetical protein HYH02_001490 [Chlamydomonas schloesseri]|uniref:ABC transporter domain-containing protein n=1 Tax=Chlamydomonas schloesseri TaxID=2026947 RepID=A0A835WW19_9CHLO|nr:hypothetical protein HYH02_001490 [Chlamydomonas schloesseri]|eukprot:KAG2454472.1 hypothetical protein HYH02_001490 [Chlamydomonas schloesseri]